MSSSPIENQYWINTSSRTLPHDLALHQFVIRYKDSRWSLRITIFHSFKHPTIIQEVSMDLNKKPNHPLNWRNIHTFSRCSEYWSDYISAFQNQIVSELIKIVRLLILLSDIKPIEKINSWKKIPDVCSCTSHLSQLLVVPISLHQIHSSVREPTTWKANPSYCFLHPNAECNTNRETRSL